MLELLKRQMSASHLTRSRAGLRERERKKGEREKEISAGEVMAAIFRNPLWHLNFTSSKHALALEN